MRAQMVQAGTLKDCLSVCLSTKQGPHLILGFQKAPEVTVYVHNNVHTDASHLHVYLPKLKHQSTTFKQWTTEWSVVNEPSSQKS